MTKPKILCPFKKVTITTEWTKESARHYLRAMAERAAELERQEAAQQKNA